MYVQGTILSNRNPTSYRSGSFAVTSYSSLHLRICRFRQFIFPFSSREVYQTHREKNLYTRILTCQSPI